MNLYGILNRGTIGKEIFCGREDSPHIDKILDGTWYHHTTTVQGYINHGMCDILEYDGRFGKGFVYCRPSWNPYQYKPSTKYMDVQYFIYPEAKQEKEIEVYPK